MKQREEIAKLILTSQLPVEERGVLFLPNAMMDCSVNGKVYITRNSGTTGILFPDWIGKGANLQGHLYINGDIAHLASKLEPNGTRVVDLNAPNPLPPPQDVHLETFEIVDPTSIGMWFKVQRTSD